MYNILKNVVNRIGISADELFANEAKNLLDEHKYILCKEKYGNYKMLVSYDNNKEVFITKDAPWGKSFSVWDMILNLFHLGSKSCNVYSFSDFEYFAVEIRPFSWIEKQTIKLLFKF
jgi:hypothetical protein